MATPYIDTKIEENSTNLPEIKNGVTFTKNKRIESIDLLRGVVMIIMALDHVRIYFYFGSFFNDPTDLDTTTPALFFTRFITHFCAPVFVFLAGTAAFLYGANKTKRELSTFLLSRGIWLIMLEIVVNNFLWTFDPAYSMLVLQVIWAIGVSMVFLSVLVYLPYRVLLGIGLIILLAHNSLDTIQLEGSGFGAILWAMVHQSYLFTLDGLAMYVHYPVLPWIAVMALGYCFGILYKKDFPQELRSKWLLGLGIGAILLFLVVRGINIYGDLVPWSVRENNAYTFFSFLNTTKYPPSLSYLLMILGPSILFLYLFEKSRNRIVDFFVVFGRVPLFYYFLHVFVIHLVALVGIGLAGGNWRDMILTADAFINASLINYGYPLWVVYLIWTAIIVLLYPVCRWYMNYKLSHRRFWWLSYL